MNVGILTNMHPRCGNFSYANDLRQELEKLGCQVVMNSEMSIFDNKKLDVMIFNYHPSRILLTEKLLQGFKDRGIKTLVIYQNSFPQRHEFGELHPLLLADAVVAHEPMDTNIKIDYIPHGIPVVEGLAEKTEMMIGTAGFPFPWKRFDVTAEAALKFQLKCLLFAPQYDGEDTDAHVEGIRGHLGYLANIHREWHTVEEIAKGLSSCLVNIFWFNSKSEADELGQSGSVRMGIAARRPMIISTHKKLKTLMPYKDEFYVAENESQVYEYVAEITKDKNPRRPNRIMDDMGWPTTAKMYMKVMERICN